MLTIRLSKVGKKNKKMFRLVISEKTKDPVGDSLEILGSYNPHTKDLKVNAEKINYWISKGAGMSETINNLLVEKKIIEGKKVKASKSRLPKKAPVPAKAVAESTPAPAEESKTEQPTA